MAAAPACFGHHTTVASFLRHPCSNNRFIRQHAARLASSKCSSPRVNSSKYLTGTHLQNTSSNGHRCSAFFKFGKSKDEYKGQRSELLMGHSYPLLLSLMQLHATCNHTNSSLPWLLRFCKSEADISSHVSCDNACHAQQKCILATLQVGIACSRDTFTTFQIVRQHMHVASIIIVVAMLV